VTQDISFIMQQNSVHLNNQTSSYESPLRPTIEENYAHKSTVPSVSPLDEFGFLTPYPDRFTPGTGIVFSFYTRMLRLHCLY